MKLSLTQRRLFLEVEGHNHHASLDQQVVRKPRITIGIFEQLHPSGDLLYQDAVSCSFVERPYEGCRNPQTLKPLEARNSFVHFSRY